MTNQAAQTMPELPEPFIYLRWDHATGSYFRCDAEDAGAHAMYTRAQLQAALTREAPTEGVTRDRESDRVRYPDKDFNEWLDAGISDAGHTVYDSIGNIADAWQGWWGHVLSVMADQPDPLLDSVATTSCPECNSPVLFECPACSHSSYPAEATPPAPQRQPLSERLYRGAPHPDAHRERTMEGASVEEPQRHPDALEDGSLSKSTAKRVDALRMAQGECNDHPDAPHGFDRTASHSNHRYVCLCEGWSPDAELSGLHSLGDDEPLIEVIRYGIRNAEKNPARVYGVQLDTLRRIESALTTQPPHQDWGEVAAFIRKWDWLILSRLKDEFAADLVALTEAKQQGTGEDRAHVQAVLNLSEAARTLGIYQAKEDAAAVAHWTGVVASCECALIGGDAPQVEAKRQTGEGANARVNGREPTHYCTQCGALWLSGDDSWSLVSLHCGKCCDNKPMMADLIKPLLRWREWPGMGHVLMGEQQ